MVPFSSGSAGAEGSALSARVGRLLRLGGSALRRIGALGRHRRVRLAFSLVVRRESGDHQAEHHDQRQQQHQNLALCFHLLTFPFFFWSVPPNFNHQPEQPY